MPALSDRPWLPNASADVVRAVAAEVAAASPTGVQALVEGWAVDTSRIHDLETLNLNPATNRMNPRAEGLLSARLGSRASLGYPGAKYETGLEAAERIEVAAAELAAEVFGARYAEVRVGSGALANLYAFMATCRPGDTIVAPPDDIGGHVTHHAAGAAGRYGLRTLTAPVDPAGYTVDLDGLRAVAREARPALITIGGSLNLFPHPVADVRAIADEVGARVLFDAAHLCGMVAGGVWPNPLAEGAHLMTMSTYKSLGGPAGGLVVTDDAGLAQRLESIAYPGLTANFDLGRTAALAVTLADWVAVGSAYARAMADAAAALAEALGARGVAVFAAERGGTRSHQLAVVTPGGGQAAAARLRRANLLACGIGLPGAAVPDDTNGLRLGTPEAVRLGMSVREMPELAGFVSAALDPEVDPESLAAEVTRWRAPFTEVLYTAERPGPR